MAEVFELPTDIPEVVLREFVTPMHPEPPDMTRFGIWDTEIDEGSTLVGGVDITPRGEDAAEVDFLVHADHVGHGYAKAAAKAAAEHAALVYDRVFAHVLDSNFAGISVLEGAGFRQTRRETLAGEATRLIFDFGAKDIVELLAPGEDLEFEPQPRGSQGRAHGYNYAAIKNNTHTEGDSVVLTVEPGGSVEPVLITGDITLSVVSLKGSGWLVKYNVEERGDVEIMPIYEGDEPLTLKRGDAYYYLNFENKELILRDDCTPSFKDTDELQLAVAPTSEDMRDGRRHAFPVGFYEWFAADRGNLVIQ